MREAGKQVREENSRCGRQQAGVMRLDEIAALTHKALYDAMEGRAFKAHTLAKFTAAHGWGRAGDAPRN